MNTTTDAAASPLQLGRGYPRPLLRRDNWQTLNGEWDFALDPPGAWHVPADVQWSRSIRVPFSPEAPLSGIANTGFYRTLWYRRDVPRPALPLGWRWLLHFGAVDYSATVWIDERIAGQHEGGYKPFTIAPNPVLIHGSDAGG